MSYDIDYFKDHSFKILQTDMSRQRWSSRYGRVVFGLDTHCLGFKNGNLVVCVFFQVLGRVNALRATTNISMQERLLSLPDADLKQQRKSKASGQTEQTRSNN